MPNHLKKISIVFVILIAFIVIAGQFKKVSADTTNGYQSLAPITINGQQDPKITTCTASTCLSQYLQNLFFVCIGVAGAMAVFMIVLGGVQYMSTDAISGKHDGKARIQNALEGLALVLLCWLIMYTINPKLVGLDFSPTVTPNNTNSTNPNNNASSTTNHSFKSCPITVNIAMNSQQYMVDNSAGSDPDTAASKVTWWEKQKYTTVGTSPSGYGRNGCYKSGQNYCLDVFAGTKFVQTDCSAGTSYSTCQGKKSFYGGKNAFTASYRCSYQ